VIKKTKHRNVKFFFKIIIKEIMKILKMVKFTQTSKRFLEYSNPESLYDYISTPSKNIIKIQQIKSEIVGLLEIIREYEPRLILEIGTLNGGTLFLFSRVANKDALIISIDLPKGNFGKLHFDWRVPLIKHFPLPNQKVKLIRANSHDKSTLGQLNKILDNKKLDFLFIDADHTYEGIKKDFEMYGPLVREGGIIAFHDIVFPPEKINTVHDFWEEIKNQYDYKEIIASETQITGGIGVLKK
jgi:predicted O-methyltransferase YrrM